MQILDSTIELPYLCGMGLRFSLTGFRMVFAIISTYMWIMTTIFSKEYLAHSNKKKRYYFFLIITYFATTLLFLSDDLFTTFVFFEIMSIASYVCVIHDEKKDTLRAGGVYLAVAVIGGLVSLMGIFLLYDLIGNLSFSVMRELCLNIWNQQNNAMIMQLYGAAACILFGFGAKAGMFPLHIWLPMAHPVAPAPASALLSGIITKSGIFGMIILAVYVMPHSPGWGILISILGCFTMLLGGVLAIFSVDIKRTLACSSMSQLGMIIVGVGLITLLGEENALAVRGTVLHMVNHSNLKLVLFMAAGVIVMNLHKLNLNEIRGYGKNKPILMMVFLSGSLGIAGVPLFNGYISKTLLHEAIVEYASYDDMFRIIEWLFLLTGAMTVCYMTKLFICVFIEDNCDENLRITYNKKTKYITKLTAFVLVISSLVMPLFGLLSGYTLNKIADYSGSFLYAANLEHEIHYFSLVNLKGAVISIVGGIILYLFFVRKLLIRKTDDQTTEYVDLWPQKANLLTAVYEPLLLVVLPAVFGFISRVIDFSMDGIILFFRRTTHRQLMEKPEIPAGFRFAFNMGTLMNKFSAFSGMFTSGKKDKRDYIYKISKMQMQFRITRRVVSASTAFSFMMFAVGISAVVIYLFISLR